MVRFGAAALAVGIVLGASAASAEDADFAAFHRICIATGGERGAALAAAEAEDFVRPPKLILDQVTTRSAVPLDNPEVRAKLIKDGFVWVSVGRMGGAFENRYTSADMCVVGVSPMRLESEKTAIAWGAVAPAVNDPQFHMLLFTGGEGAHRAAPKADDEALAAVAAGDRLQLLGAGHTEGVTLMLYGVVKAAPAP
jgi:hypothetical protein